MIRKVSKKLGIPVAVCGDLQGPKIRVGKIPEGVGKTAKSGGGTVVVKEGEEVVLSRAIDQSLIRSHGGKEEAVFSLTYKDLVEEVEVGHSVLINDGAIRMTAVSKDLSKGELRCKVTVGGAVTTGKGINVPQSIVKASAITAKDWQCVEWAVKHDLDYLALSFVSHGDEVKELKTKMKKFEAAKIGKDELTSADGVKSIGVISKIEKPQAITNLQGIVEASDAVMVARGDLGVELEVEMVPIIQKVIIETCQAHGKPVIVATQMLETMIENSVPTRAEASDVGNAVFDGADAVMLSAESATGKHPGLVVETMTKIVKAAEGRILEKGKQNAPPTRYTAANKLTAVMAYGAWHVVKDTKVKYVVCWSQNGNAARYLSQNDFSIPIIAFSEKSRCVNQMALFNNITPVLHKTPKLFDDFIQIVDTSLLSSGMANKGDLILIMGGRPLGESKSTNSMQIHEVGHSNSKLEA